MTNIPFNVDLRATLPKKATTILPPLLEELFRLCLERVELPEGAVELIVIADETQFGPTVYEFQDAARRRREYTDRGINLAVGKTIPFRPSPDTVTSRIVILSNIVLEAITPLLEGRPPERWKLSEQTCFYIVCHELGHGADNHTRRDDDDPPQSAGDFRVAQIATYYTGVLKGELAASALSARGMTREVYDDSAEQLRDLARQALAAVDALRSAYQCGDDTKLYSLGMNASNAFWTICVQYAKLVASEAANPELPQDEVELWEGAPEGVKDVLTHLAAHLRRMWTAYPAWDEDFDPALFEAWDKLSRTYGYEFFSTAEADGLHLH